MCTDAYTHTHTKSYCYLLYSQENLIKQWWDFPLVIPYVSAFKELKVGVSVIFLDMLPKSWEGDLGTLG